MLSHFDMEKHRAVLSVGQVCADLITLCDEYPEEDAQVRVETQYWQRGGNAGNVAEVLSHLGTQAEFFGTFPNVKKMRPAILGGAAAAKFCLSELDRAGVDYSHIARKQCEDFPSSSILLSDKTGTRTIAHYRGPLDELTISDFSVLDFKEYSWIHFEGRGNVETIASAIEMASTSTASMSPTERTKLSVELELARHDDLMHSCKSVDLVVVSRYFAKHRGFRTAIECVEGMKTFLKPRAEIVCSWGEAGAACATNIIGDKAVLIPATKPEKVADTLGAGDTFQAALIHARLHDLSLENSVKYACKVASKKISARGYNAVKGMGL